MKNHKPHKPVSNQAPQLPQVMQIRVGTTVSQQGRTSIPSSLLGRRAAIVTGPIAATHYITLNEIDVDEPTWFSNLNGLHFEDPITETPNIFEKILVALGGIELNRLPLQNWLVRVSLRFERGPLTAKV